MTLVFGYGSNMDDGQMDTRCPNREKIGIAVLRNYRLCFPRLSQNRGCGVSSVEPAAGGEVWGVVHRLNEADLRSLDKSEGLRPGRGAEANGYNRISITVELKGSLIEVQTYIAVATKNPPAPNIQYLTHIRNGAQQHNLPDSYREWLAKL
ncbi:gamma-glutamylcyclotransferase [Mesorhizobium sp. B2-4-19]|uniref:gamma-glutamylcyclotransferase family protein n=1 Tax=Mesorhizobium sp. B2-4-19 TaxID=2589930 RepID=UPI00112950CE|nr:gamma-glutamylcyclotransferase family protein [Mesorhizobium sp. B2-4-19]TPK61661.1 gamma-glutamylcyclotransferase [Mesorhizobium sp. B2-4-19]